MNEKEYGAMRFGQVICFLMGMFGFIAFFSSIFLPDDLRHMIISDAYVVHYSQYKLLFRLSNISFIIFEIMSVGLIAFFYILVRPKNFALVFFASLLGAYGSFLGSIFYLRLIVYVDRLYYAVISSNQLESTLLLTIGAPNYEQRLFIVGLPAMWWLVISYLALDNPFIPRPLVVLGGLIGLVNVAYLVLFVIGALTALKWVFLLNSFFLITWTVLEFRFISRVIKRNESNIIQS